MAILPMGIWFVQNVAGLAQVHGRSMEPTLNPPENLLKNDVVLLDKFSVSRLHLYRVGDVVILSHPRDSKRQLVKRILALPGDLVKPWLPPGTRDGYEPPVIKIPAGHMWVESDEPFHGQDSNTFGPVPLGLVSARVAWIVWPRFQRVPKERVGGPILGQTNESKVPRIRIFSGGVWDGRQENMRSGSSEVDLDELRLLHFGKSTERHALEEMTR